MLALYTATIFLSASLLFLLQPFTGKLLLPLLGGSPSVWNVCMVFFQGALLLGYLYSHGVTRLLKPWQQAVVHLALMLFAAWTLPIPTSVGVPDQNNPTIWLLTTLAWTVGPPFFVAATTGPLLQSWFGRTGHARSKDPYFLYVSSNAGSALGLLAYPFGIEPRLTLSGQSDFWRYGFYGLVPLIAACAGFMLARGMGKQPREVNRTPESARPIDDGSGPLTWKRRGRWTLLAMVPSSLMLGATQHITTDIAAVPLLWIIPLLLYLVSFMVVFSERVRVSARSYGAALPWAALALVAVTVTFIHYPVPPIVAIHLSVFTLTAFMCHRMLAEDRPPRRYLTEFYLWLAVGGVLGGMFNSLLAPVVFDRLLEYPLMIGVALMLRPQSRGDVSARGWGLGIGGAIAAFAVIGATTMMLPRIAKLDGTAILLIQAAGPLAVIALGWRFGGTIPLALCVSAACIAALYSGRGSEVLYTARTFFGVNQVVGRPAGAWHVIKHGTTSHGLQGFAESRRREPASYYHRTGPLGSVFGVLHARPGGCTVGVLGLGAGAIAAYSRKDDHFKFYEIDERVIHIATTPRYFTYLTDAVGRIEVVHGDGRLAIGAEPGGMFDLIIMDAFSSDSVPVHLITREAFERVYLPRLKRDGLIVVNTSNRLINLPPLLGATARALGLRAYVRYDLSPLHDESVRVQGKHASSFVVMARSDGALGPIAREADSASVEPDNRWRTIHPPPGTPVWTDDFSNILSAIEWGGGAALGGGK